MSNDSLYPRIYKSYVDPIDQRLCSNPTCRRDLNRCNDDLVESEPIDAGHHIEFCSRECANCLFTSKEMEYCRIDDTTVIRKIFLENNFPNELPIPEYIWVRYYWMTLSNERGRVRDIYYPVGESAHVRIDCDEARHA